MYVCVFVLGAVSLAGAQNNLWAVEGGNKLVCSGLLKIANANLLQAQVNSISPVYSGTPIFTEAPAVLHCHVSNGMYPRGPIL